MVGGKAVDCQAKQICYNVYLHYKKRKQDRSSVEFQDDLNIMATVAEITGFSKTTVFKIVKEGNKLVEQTGTCIFKPQEKKNVLKKRLALGKYREGLIRRKAIQFYAENKEPTLRKLNQLLKDENIISCSVEYLRQLLRKIGFNNIQQSKRMNVERPDIIAERCNYLQAISEYRTQNRNIFYLNETKFWQSDEDEITWNLTNTLQMPSIIIVHASGGDGFIDGSLIMLKMKHKNSQEKDRIYEHFDKYDWIKDCALSNLSPSSVVVTNIPYVEPASEKDNRPKSSSTRSEIEEWLGHHSISFNASDSKAELLDLMNINKQKEKEYSIEKALEEAGHTILHLPQNHADLNPVFLAWDELDNDSEEMNPVVLFNNCSRDRWQKYFDRVMKNEAEYVEHGTKLEAVNNLASVKMRSNGDEEETYSDEGGSST